MTAHKRKCARSSKPKNVQKYSPHNRPAKACSKKSKALPSPPGIDNQNTGGQGRWQGTHPIGLRTAGFVQLKARGCSATWIKCVGTRRSRRFRKFRRLSARIPSVPEVSAPVPVGDELPRDPVLLSQLLDSLLARQRDAQQRLKRQDRDIAKLEAEVKREEKTPTQRSRQHRSKAMLCVVHARRWPRHVQIGKNSGRV